MERRELLRHGLLLGAALAAEPAPAGPKAGSLAFFEGDFRERAYRGSDFPGWTLVLSITGTRAQGRADGPSLLEGTPRVIRGLRLQGRLTGARLRMDVFTLEDVNLCAPIGRLEGLLDRYGNLNGTLDLPGRGTSAFRARVLPIDAAASQQLAGRYQGSIRNLAGEPLYTGDLTVRDDLTWELRDLKAAAPGFPMLISSAARRLGGRWGVTRDGTILLSITQVPLRFRTSSAGSGRSPWNRPAGRRKTAIGQPARTLQFRDSEFPEANWTAVKIRDDSAGEAAAFEAGQRTGGGNPGAFRAVRHLLPDGATVSVAHLLGGAEYVRPADSAAPIESIDFSYDVRAMIAVSFLPLVVYTPAGGQATYYAAAGPLGSEVWTRFGPPTLRLGDLVRVAGPGPVHLDASLTGTFQFGVLSQSSTPGLRGEHALEANVDNFLVEISTPAPDTARSLELTGPDAAYAGAQVCYTATVRDPDGEPIEEAEVRFEATGQNGTAVLTNSSGQAQFCFIPTGAGPMTVVAFLDENGSGVEDDGDVSDRIEAVVTPLAAITVEVSARAEVLIGEPIRYQAKATDELSGPVVGARVGLEFGDGGTPIFERTDATGTARFDIAEGVEADRTIPIRAWLDANEDGFFSRDEPSDTTELRTIPRDDACVWFCTIVSVLRSSRVRNGAGRTSAAAIRLEHPHLQNLLLCADPVPGPIRE